MEDTKSEEKNTWQNIKLLYESREAVIKLLNDDMIVTYLEFLFNE